MKMLEMTSVKKLNYTDITLKMTGERKESGPPVLLSPWKPSLETSDARFMIWRQENSL